MHAVPVGQARQISNSACALTPYPPRRASANTATRRHTCAAGIDFAALPGSGRGQDASSHLLLGSSPSALPSAGGWCLSSCSSAGCTASSCACSHLLQRSPQSRPRFVLGYFVGPRWNGKTVNTCESFEYSVLVYTHTRAHTHTRRCMHTRTHCIRVIAPCGATTATTLGSGCLMSICRTKKERGGVNRKDGHG